MQVIKTKYGYAVKPYYVGYHSYRHNGEYIGSHIEDEDCYTNHKNYLYETGGRTGYLYCAHPSHYDGNEVEVIGLSARERSEFHIKDYLIEDTCHGRWKCRYNQGTIFVLKNPENANIKKTPVWKTVLNTRVKLNVNELENLKELFKVKFKGEDLLSSYIITGSGIGSNPVTNEITIFNLKDIIENDGLCTMMLQISELYGKKRVVLKSHLDKYSVQLDRETILKTVKEFFSICNTYMENIEKMIAEV